MKKIFALALGSFILLSGFAITSHAGTSSIFGGQSGQSLSEVLPKVMPAVVNIAAQGEVPNSNQNPFVPPNRNQSQSRQFESLGSGVIMDAANGYILTNEHVVRDAKSITVTLKDGRVFKAKLIGADPASDIALIQIKADHLIVAPLGNSDNLKVGDFVAAIGSPFGLNQTVTSGIVSAIQRSGLGIEGYENFIQTDASINPGNSGGALVNLQGQVIGINTAILSSGFSQGNIGIGFAIPINMAQGLMQQLIKYGAVRRGLMGVLVQDLTPALATAFHLNSDTGGALIAQVSPFSPAAAAGIKAGDIVMEVNGQKVQNAPQIRNAIGMLRAGSKIDLKLLRNGKNTSASLTIADPQQYMQVAENSNPFLFGMNLQNFDQTVTPQGHIVGVQIIGINENSMAYRAGLRPGDVITSANQTNVSTVEQLQKIAKDSKDELLVNVVRRTGAAFVVIK